jgi:histidine ammonia-lyase
MAGQPLVQSLGEHDYLVQVREGEDLIEIRVHATPAVVARIAASETDEDWIIEATAAYLIARQRADDLPATLDLDDVAAAYDDYIVELRGQLDTR